jgi:MFS family permease
VLGYGALEVGLAFLPVTVVIGILSLGYAERLNMRFGPKATLVPGLVLIVVALLLFAQTPVDGGYVRDLLPVMLLLGLGAGLAFPALAMLAMSSVPQNEAGLASGLVNTSLQVGGALGLAILATLATERTGTLRAGGESAASALTGGYHLAFYVGAGLSLAGTLVALAVIRSPAHPAEEEAPEPEQIRTASAYQEAA